MSKEMILSFARGRNDLKQSYIVLFDVDEAGTVNIHSCKRCSGTGTMIRFVDYSGTKKEVAVSDDELDRAIEAFIKVQAG